jgi:syntaxin 6
MVDPYYLSQREVVTGISSLRSMLGNREDILTDSRGGNPEIFKSIGDRMRDGLQTIRGLLDDITATIRQIESNRSFFKITDSELQTRKTFVAESQHELEDIERRTSDQSANQKMQFSVSAFQPVVGSTRELGSGPGQIQLQVYQEEQIDRIADTVRMQKMIGHEIIHAIDEQHQMIIEIDAGVDTAEAAMKQVTQRITQLIASEGKVPTYLVAVLALVLVLMLWWVA